MVAKRYLALNRHYSKHVLTTLHTAHHPYLHFVDTETETQEF